MSARLAIAAMTLSLGCSSHEAAAPRPPEAPARAQSEPVKVAEPTRPTPAFAPPRAGGCAPDYALVDGTCVHRAYEPTGEPLTRALADYKRGVAPPMLGPSVPRPRDPAVPRPLDPGALSRPADADAGAAKDRRLSELDAMLEVARERLRVRDENSKAKRVDGPSASDAGTARVTTVVSGTPGGTFAVTAPQDPMEARQAELNQLTNMMSSEQLRAMSGELGKLGIDQKQLDALINEARSDQPGL
jgi:hypothetical protein